MQNELFPNIEKYKQVLKDENDWGNILTNDVVAYDDNIVADRPVLNIVDEDKTYDLMSEGNFTSIIGQAKSRKSYLATLFCSAYLNGGVYQDTISANPGGEVVYFDTEQGKVHVHRMVKRIHRMSGTDKFTMYAMRRYSPHERVSALNWIIENTVGLKLLVIDGIVDLIRAINDEDQSTELVTRLLKWTELYQIHIITIIHQNPKDLKARGHIGTMVQHKSETVLEAKAGANDLTQVTCLFSRGMKFPTFNFEIVDYLPKITGFEERISF